LTPSEIIPEVLNVEDWAEIRRLHRSEGMAVKAIARKMGVSRNTVRAALRAVDPPRYKRDGAGSIVDEVEPKIRALLKETPDMPSTVIAERIGWDRGLTVLKQRVRELRPEYRALDPSSRTAYQPGELAQCDLWFPAKRITLGAGVAGILPVLVMVLGYSRWLMARMIPSRQASDLIAGHWSLLSELGAVPKALVWDNEGAVGSWRGGRPVLTDDFASFRGSLGIKVIQCRPGDPEAKGLVERANGYLETSFLPGRSFEGPHDFNQQLKDWLVSANQRRHRIIECRPWDRLAEDRSAMVALPPRTPVLGWRHSTRLPRDHYVRVHTCDYSVHPSAVGRRVDVVCDLDTVTVSCAGHTVARHPRCWAPHQTIADPVHVAAAEEMRRARLQVVARPRQSEVEVRPLSVYDAAFEAGEGVA
jgi:transposase